MPGCQIVFYVPSPMFLFNFFYFKGVHRLMMWPPPHSLLGSGCLLKMWALSFLLWMLSSILCWLPIVLYLLILLVLWELTDWCYNPNYSLVALTCTYQAVFCLKMFTGSDFNRFIFVPIGVSILSVYWC